MRKFLATTLLFGTAVMLVQAQGTGAKLDGTWVLTGIGEKKDLPPAFFDEIQAKLIFKDGNYEQIVKDKKIESGKIKIDAAKSPATIDFEIDEGMDKGKTQLGIFKLDGNRLILAVGKAGSATRPKNFENMKDGEVTFYKQGK
jgi:uncharacterized protein (TIGR03067 family)